MASFIDPDDFASDDELLDHIIENVVRPSLSEEIGRSDLSGIQGVAYVFGGRQDVDPAMLSTVYRLVEGEGVSVEYALREFTCLRVGKMRHASRGGLHVHYIELMNEPEEQAHEHLSSDQLAAMFRR
ncbi:MAG: hypothetical protein EA402_10455 [Planctomycetota bacterium]|nr:MAG: hypothetical protein EA402_10455 [Planctomycetota bacterium]